MGFRVLLACATLPLLVPLVGCAHTDAIAERQFAEMRETMGKVQAEQDKTSGRDFAEMSTDEQRAPAAQASQAAAPSPSGKPTQRTVQIGQDDDDGQNDDPDAPTARPEIRLEGNHVAAPREGRRRSAGRGRDADDTSRSDRSDGTRAAVPALDPDARKAYDAALALVDAKRYDRALEALSAFLGRYPDHPYAENATYWRGECYFARGEYLRAAEQFEAVISRYSGNKAPDALLKMGMAHDRLGSPERAKEYWERLRRDYPRSDAAKKIPGSRNDAKSSGSGPKEDR
jgi:tol-pal system protein YbgF